MSVNKVILVGRLGKNPETRYLTSGDAVCNFSMATEESWKDRAGERQKKTEWHRIVVFGKQAEIAQKYLGKGSLLYLEGRIQTREWEKDGQKRTATEIVASNFRMLGGGKRDEQDQRTPEETSTVSQEISDEDVPF